MKFQFFHHENATLVPFSIKGAEKLGSLIRRLIQADYTKVCFGPETNKNKNLNS